MTPDARLTTIATAQAVSDLVASIIEVDARPLAAAGACIEERWVAFPDAGGRIHAMRARSFTYGKTVHFTLLTGLGDADKATAVQVMQWYQQIAGLAERGMTLRKAAETWSQMVAAGEVA